LAIFAIVPGLLLLICWILFRAPSCLSSVRARMGHPDFPNVRWIEGDGFAAGTCRYSTRGRRAASRSLPAYGVRNSHRAVRHPRTQSHRTPPAAAVTPPAREELTCPAISSGDATLWYSSSISFIFSPQCRIRPSMLRPYQPPTRAAAIVPARINAFTSLPR